MSILHRPEVKLPLDSIKKEGGNSIEAIRFSFVESFRQMIRFDVEALKPGDDDYIEFGNDTKVPLISAAKLIEYETELEWAAYPIAIILIRRLMKTNDYCININNMHRLMLVSLLIASKIIEDCPSSNRCFSKSIGFKESSLKEMEIEFLKCVEFKLHVTLEEVNTVLSEWSLNRDWIGSIELI